MQNDDASESTAPMSGTVHINGLISTKRMAEITVAEFREKILQPDLKSLQGGKASLWPSFWLGVLIVLTSIAVIAWGQKEVRLTDQQVQTLAASRSVILSKEVIDDLKQQIVQEIKANALAPAKEVDLGPLLAKLDAIANKEDGSETSSEETVKAALAPLLERLAVIEAKIPTPEQSAKALLTAVMNGISAKRGEEPIEVSLQVAEDGSTAVRWDKKEE